MVQYIQDGSGINNGLWKFIPKSDCFLVVLLREFVIGGDGLLVHARQVYKRFVCVAFHTQPPRLCCVGTTLLWLWSRATYYNCSLCSNSSKCSRGFALGFLARAPQENLRPARPFLREMAAVFDSLWEHK